MASTNQNPTRSVTIPIKVGKYHPDRLAVRMCNIHGTPCSLVLIINSVGSQVNSDRELFCVNCQLVLHWDDTHVKYVDVKNQKRIE